MNKTIIATLLCLSGFAAVFGQGVTRRFAAGYDEGLAARFFFNDRVGVQASLHVEYLGGYDETDNNGGAQYEETDIGFGGAFLLNLFRHEKVLLDAMAQAIIYHDGDDQPGDYGDRTLGFVRIAACPEFIVAEHLGFGMKVGMEVAYTDETEEELPGGDVITTDDETTDFRFFGPRNPFDGPVLGLSLFYYF